MLAHSSERVISDSEGEASKVETQKKKNGSIVFMLTSANNQKASIPRTEQIGVVKTAERTE